MNTLFNSAAYWGCFQGNFDFIKTAVDLQIDI